MALRAVGALLTVLLFGACSRGDSGATPSATVPVEQTTTSTTEVDVSTIPPTIDEAYVNKVLAALDAVDGEATRLIVQNRAFVPEAAARLRAIYDEQEFRKQTDAWLMDLQKGLPRYKPDPGARKTTVVQLLEKTDHCIFASVMQDFSLIATDSGSPSLAYVLLIPLDRSRDKRGINPTAWMVHEEGYNKDGSIPRGLCAGS